MGGAPLDTPLQRLHAKLANVYKCTSLPAKETRKRVRANNKRACLIANIGLGQKYMSMTNGPAYRKI